jgi:hypothetical protein
MKTCKNEKCRKPVTSKKEHAEYCSPACGDAFRHRQYRRRQKK